LPESSAILSETLFQFQRVYLPDLSDVDAIPELRGADIMEASFL
jgi:hypothetical protein